MFPNLFESLSLSLSEEEGGERNVPIAVTKSKERGRESLKCVKRGLPILHKKDERSFCYKLEKLIHSLAA